MPKASDDDIYESMGQTLNEINDRRQDWRDEESAESHALYFCEHEVAHADCGLRCRACGHECCYHANNGLDDRDCGCGCQVFVNRHQGVKYMAQALSEAGNGVSDDES